MKNDRQDLESRITGLSGDELLTALINRKEYTSEAAEIIVKESLRRGVIHNEDDLLSPQFNPSPRKFSFFPFPETEFSRDKILKSLMRSVMLPGVIPVYFGVMKFSFPKYTEGVILISVGAVWVIMALIVMLKSERRLIIPMAFLLLLSALYAGRIMLAYQHLRWTDIFIPVLLYIFITYCLIYTFILLRKARRETREL
jgi:hypothetical protein